MSEPDYLTVYLYAHEMARKDITKLKDENARLAAELDRVTSQNGYHHTGLAVGMLREELAHKCHDNLEIRKAHQATVQMVRDIQAEVERLTQELKDEKSANANVEGRQQSANRNLGMENARLKAEVERLKAVSTIEQRTIQGLQQTPEWSEIARLTAYCRELEAKLNREGNQS